MIARIVAALAFLFVCTGAVAQERRGTANVTARLTAEGMRADIRLSRAVTSFTFNEAEVVRDGDFTILTEGLTLTGDTITSERPFRRIELIVRPMARERDAKYPAFYRVGQGGVLYAPALYADQASWRTTLRIPTTRGQSMAPSRGPGHNGSVFIGPADHITQIGATTMVAPPDVPRGLYQAVYDELQASMAFYTRELGLALTSQPLVVINGNGDGQGYVGDALPGPAVSMRFYGADWSDPSPQAAAYLARFASHEAFHFWNGAMVSTSEGTPSWLHEGGAEYAALLSANASGAYDEAAVRAALGDALTRCRDALQAQGDVGMNSFSFLNNQVRYPCGTVIQWASDLSVRRASNGERDVLDVWSSMMRAAIARGTRRFTLADFTDAEGNDGVALPISLLAEQSGGARWATLVETLNGLGAGIRAEPNDTTRRTALLFHLLSQNCPGAENYGFFTEPEGIRLDTVSQCGAFAGAMLNSVEGADPMAVSAETYARAQAACANRRGVAAVVNGAPATFVCNRPLRDAPNAYIVQRWR